METAVQQIFHLQDFGIVRDRLDHAELRPGLELEIEYGQRLLYFRVEHFGSNADFLRQPPEPNMVMVLLHCHPAGQPLGVRRRRQRNGGLVEHLRAVKLVDRVADDDLLHRCAVFLRLVHQFGCGLHFDGGCGCHGVHLKQAARY